MKRLTTLAICALLGATGCQSTPEAPSSEQTNAQKQQEVSTFAVYEQSKADYEKWVATLAESSDLKIYSSDLYADLLSAWDDAAEVYNVFAADPAKATSSYSIFSSATYAEEFAEQLTEVTNKYALILKIKKQADLILSDSIAQMHYLDEIGASKYYNKQYQSLYKDYIELFEYIEEDDIDDAKDEQVQFLTNAKNLEIKVALVKYIAPLQKQLADFRAQGFNSVVSISFAKAEAEIKSASTTVKTNTRNVTIIEKAVAKAEFELAHVSNISSEVRSLVNTDSDEYELVILAFEEKLLSVSNALNGADYRDQSLQVQAELIVESLNKLHADNKTDELASNLALLTADLEKMTKTSNAQALLLEQSKDKNASLYKEIARGEIQIESLQAELNSYKQSVAVKSQVAAVTPEATTTPKPAAETTPQAQVAPVTTEAVATPAVATETVTQAVVVEATPEAVTETITEVVTETTPAAVETASEVVSETAVALDVEPKA